MIETLEVAGGGALDKAVGIVGALPHDLWTGVVVDVGCRRCDLEKRVKDAQGTYFGIDLSPTGDVICRLGRRFAVANRERGHRRCARRPRAH